MSEENIDDIKPPFEIVLFTNVKDKSDQYIKDVFKDMGFNPTRVDKKKNFSGAYVRFPSRQELKDVLRKEVSLFDKFFEDPKIELNRFFIENRKNKSDLKKNEPFEKHPVFKNHFGSLPSDDED